MFQEMAQLYETYTSEIIRPLFWAKHISLVLSSLVATTAPLGILSPWERQWQLASLKYLWITFHVLQLFIYISWN